MDWPTYVRHVEKARKFGEVYGCEHYWKDGLDFDKAIKVIQGLGFVVKGGLPNISLSRESARQFMVDMLTRCMTYDNRLHSAHNAESLADFYMSFHNEGALFYTNGSLTRTLRGKTAYGTWTTLLNPSISAFDTGLFSVTDEMMRLIWFVERQK